MQYVTYMHMHIHMVHQAFLTFGMFLLGINKESSLFRLYRLYLFVLCIEC